MFLTNIRKLSLPEQVYNVVGVSSRVRFGIADEVEQIFLCALTYNHMISVAPDLVIREANSHIHSLVELKQWMVEYSEELSSQR